MNRLPPPPASAQWAWFLDVDGTLIGATAVPSALAMSDAVKGLLDRLQHASGGALALVSGRSLDNLTRLTAPVTLAAAGLHGLERRQRDGSIVRLPVPDGLADIRRRFVQAADRLPGVVMEDKQVALGLYYPHARHQAAAAMAVAQAVVLDHPDFALVEGHCIVEIAPRGADKASAVAAFMAAAPFAGRRPVFVGDDLPDESAFAAVNGMDGISVRIGDGDSAARYGLADIAACLDWIARGLA